MTATAPETSTGVASEPVVTLTESAARQIVAMQSEDKENAGKALRVFIEAGGCSGLQYGMVFDEVRAEDHSVEFFGVRVVVDAVSVNYIRGAMIDFSEELTGGGFKIANPNAHSSCGCGKSFEA